MKEQLRAWNEQGVLGKRLAEIDQAVSKSAVSKSADLPELQSLQVDAYLQRLTHLQELVRVVALHRSRKPRDIDPHTRQRFEELLVRMADKANQIVARLGMENLSAYSDWSALAENQRTQATLYVESPAEYLKQDTIQTRLSSGERSDLRRGRLTSTEIAKLAKTYVQRLKSRRN